MLGRTVAVHRTRTPDEPLASVAPSSLGHGRERALETPEPPTSTPDLALLEIQRLQAIDGSGLLAAPAPPELEEICLRAKARFQVAMALVTLVTKDRLIIKARVGTSFEELPRRGQFCEHTICSDAVFVVADAMRDPRFALNPAVAGEPLIRFYAGAPLIYFRRLRLGSLCLLDPTPRPFLPDDQAELAQMAGEAASALVMQEIDSKAVARGLERRR